MVKDSDEGTKCGDGSVFIVYVAAFYGSQKLHNTGTAHKQTEKIGFQLTLISYSLRPFNIWENISYVGSGLCSIHDSRYRAK